MRSVAVAVDECRSSVESRVGCVVLYGGRRTDASVTEAVVDLGSCLVFVIFEVSMYSTAPHLEIYGEQERKNVLNVFVQKLK